MGLAEAMLRVAGEIEEEARMHHTGVEQARIKGFAETIRSVLVAVQVPEAKPVVGPSDERWRSYVNSVVQKALDRVTALEERAEGDGVQRLAGMIGEDIAAHGLRLAALEELVANHDRRFLALERLLESEVQQLKEQAGKLKNIPTEPVRVGPPYEMDSVAIQKVELSDETKKQIEEDMKMFPLGLVQQGVQERGPGC